MKITYSLDAHGANPLTLSPALLVLACDPRLPARVMTATPEEKDLFKQLQNFTFYTTTLRVYPVKEQDRVVILDPATCELMAGAMHGYRNETAKQWGLARANSALGNDGTNVITTYQLVRAGQPVSQAQMQKKLESFLNSPPAWWPFAAGQYKVVRVAEEQGHEAPHQAVNPLLTSYFNHFSGEQLLAGAPWKWFDLQGENKTVYVHASTYFESVLHCWDYIEQLFSHKGGAFLPGKRTAQIVIVGAGVSGLLAAYHLRQRGYHNLLLLEATNRYGGKTHSLRVPDQGGITVAELGTCYMSPAYDSMVSALSEFTVGNERIVVAPRETRGMVYGTGSTAQVMNFMDYGRRYAAKQINGSWPWPLTSAQHEKVEKEIDAAALAYGLARAYYFSALGNKMPIPRPASDPFGIFTKTFGQFLSEIGNGVLIGFMQYAYEVQGYGSLEHISAYYGLAWISPEMVWPFGKDAGVTGWAKGWEDVWEQLVEKEQLPILLNANVLRIERGLPPVAKPRKAKP